MIKNDHNINVFTFAVNCSTLQKQQPEKSFDKMYRPKTSIQRNGQKQPIKNAMKVVKKVLVDWDNLIDSASN